MEGKKTLTKDYERPPEWCPFKVKNIKECDAKRLTVKRIEEDSPFKVKIDKLEINCYCKFPMYHFLKDLAPYNRSWKDLVDNILEDDY